MSAARFPRIELLIVLLTALLARLLLLASGAVSFHSDEAVVALMARHILGGERPVFFYGQAYMGSLDAWLVALGFRLLGESVLTIRLVQSALYLAAVAVGFGVAWVISRRPTIALVTGLALAVPTVNVALYTTATLGGYNETLVLGGLLLLLGYQVAHDHVSSWWRWAVLGLCAGLGWWTHGLIAIYALPVALLVLYTAVLRGRFVQRGKVPPLLPLNALIPRILLAVALFVLGSAPWWVFDFAHDHAALSTFLTNRQSGPFAGIGLPYVPPEQRALGLLALGLPALIGLRFPWSSEFFLLPVGLVTGLIYLAGIIRLRAHNPLLSDARGLVISMLALFFIIFIASSFGADPTGRYFLPLALPLGILLGSLVETIPIGNSTLRRALQVALVALVVGYQGAGQVAAASRSPGLTTQFDLISHIPNDDDAALIAFLTGNGLQHGYTSYWVAFRIAFLSGETLQYHAALPYKESLDYNPADSRYPPYAETTARAERVAFITANLPALDERLREMFSAQGLTYREARIGPYLIYHDFQPRRPAAPRFDAVLSR